MDKDNVVIHMFLGGCGGVEGIVEKISFSPPARMAGPAQEAILHLTLSWNRDRNRCGPFIINVGELVPGEIRHFDLLLCRTIPFPIPKDVVLIFPHQVGLDAWDRETEIFWCRGLQPRYVRGAGTPYPITEENESLCGVPENSGKKPSQPRHNFSG